MATRRHPFETKTIKRARTACIVNADGMMIRHDICVVYAAQCQQEDNCIQCDGCEAWMHIVCIRMSNDQLNVYSILSHAQFYCLSCTMDARGQVNFRACLSRIAACAPQVVRMRQQAENEQVLLSFYRCALPESSQPSADEVTADAASEALLSKHSPWLLTQFVPVSVAGDGNCLFRAVFCHVRS